MGSVERKIFELKVKAAEIRRDILGMALKSGSGHIAPGLSCTDILTVLYYGGILKYDSKNPDWDGRDRFILSKGHGCMPLYIILADVGFFSKANLNTFAQRGSILGCHADKKLIPGIEVTTGSLGLGLSVATGMAVAAKYDKKKYRIYAVLGDGECQEGTVWEALMYAGANGLDNLTIIIDYNGYGATARIRDTANIAPMAEKLNAFNFSVKEVDGHNIGEILAAIQTTPFENGKPSAIVAHTMKGKGLSIMENDFLNGDPKWHYRVPKKGVGNEDPVESMMELEMAVEQAKKELGVYQK